MKLPGPLVALFVTFVWAYYIFLFIYALEARP